MLRSPKRDEAKTPFMKSVEGLANVLALIATYLGTPPLHRATSGFIQRYTAENYGEMLADPASFVWFCLVAASVFFISRATLSTAIVMGGLMLASRFAF
ncbi:hypothetical protein [Woodsholea maritima]|uniref:hypothetical protein n=1 Tax=Woodsholea maritima TaxID=240237 RepID=UPI00036B913D|nr:hypothetical protein [Woodsholea maritima]